MTIRDIAIAFGFKSDGSEKKVEKTIGSLKSMATKALAAIGIGFSLTKMNQMLEEWYSVNKVLATVNTGLRDQTEIQNRILSVANSCRVAYKDMCDYVNDLVKSGSKMFSTAEDAAAFLEIANKAFKTSGASASELGSLNNTLKSAFQTGKLSAGGFNTIMQQSPDIVQYLADSLGVSLQQVKALGLSGNITAKQLYSAFANSADLINERYEKMGLTISETFTVIRNEFGTWLSQMNEAYGITDSLSRLILRAFRWILSVVKSLVNWFDRLVAMFGSAKRAALVLATAIGAIVVAFKWEKIVSGLKAIAAAMTGVAGKVMLVVGAVLLVILLLDDLIAFANGDSSLIGEMFEKMGVDAEGLRSALKQLFDMFKQIFSMIMPVLQKLVQLVMPVLQKLMQAQLEIQSKIMEVVVQLATMVLGIVVELLEAILPLIETLFELLEPIFDLLMLIVDAVMLVIDAVMALIKPLLDLISEILKPIISIVRVIVDIFTGQLGGAFKFIASIVDNLVNGPLRGFLDFLGQIIKFISAVFTGDWETAWKALGNIPISIINGIIGAFESMINFFIGMINGITSALSSLWTWIGIPGIPEIPEVSLGRISYLAEGGYVEKDHPMPVVIGDNKKEGEIVSPVSKMRQAVIDALVAFSGKATAGQRGGAASTIDRQNTARTITQTVYMYNTFEGAKDIQRTTSKAMSQSARDLTGELADALAYLR